MRRFMGDLGDLSGLDIAVAATLPTGTDAAAPRSPAERGGRPILHGTALLRTVGFEARRDGRCRAGHPGAGVPLREAAHRGCSPLAGA